jgi:hypothetical protein
MALKLKALLEGYAWERKADGSLPTLKDAIATHAANLGENVLEDKIAKAEKDLKQVKDKWYNLNSVSNPTASQQAEKDRLKKQMGDLVTQLKRDKRELKTGSAGYNKQAKPDFLDLDKDGNTDEPMKSAAKEMNEYGEDEFDRDPEMYGGGKSSREYAGIPSELVEQIEDHVERLMQNLSTNSKIPTSEKEVILKGLVKISDLIDQLQDEL